jgi:hypothetical protein
MGTIVDVEDYRSLQNLIGEVRKHLADSLASRDLRIPRLADELIRSTDDVFDRFLSGLVVSPPGDLGGKDPRTKT